MSTLLHIDSCLNTGSTGRITEAIGSMALKCGWKCYIAHSSRYSNPPSCMSSFKMGTLFGEYLHYGESLFFDNHGLSSRTETKCLINYIKSIKPDVIHLHCIHGYYLNYKILFEYLNKTEIQIVWTFHDCWAFTGHCAYFDRIKCNKWKTGCCKCELIGDYPKALMDNSSRNYNIKKTLFSENQNLHIVTVSKWLEGLSRESFFKKKDIRTIYNGVDINIFKPTDSEYMRQKLGIGNKKVLLAAATVWAERKGFNDYIELSKMLSDDMVIILLGLDKKKSVGLPSNIIGIEKTESIQDMASFYSLADIVLNLSYEETFGLTTAEGMACGTPSIVYDATASPELITPETGLIVEPGNVKGVFNAIQKMVKTPKVFFSKSCRARAVCSFNKDKQFEEYIKLYEDII